MIGPSRMPSLLSFLFNLAWASRVRLPLLIAAAFMVTNIHMRLEININFEMEEQIVVHQEASENGDDSSDDDDDDDDDDDYYYDDDDEVYYCTDDELFFTDDEDDSEDNEEDDSEDDGQTINRDSVGDSDMQNKNEAMCIVRRHPCDTTEQLQQSSNAIKESNDSSEKNSSVER